MAIYLPPDKVNFFYQRSTMCFILAEELRDDAKYDFLHEERSDEGKKSYLAEERSDEAKKYIVDQQ